jgi:hypothetical protein
MPRVMPTIMQNPNRVETAYILWLGCLLQLHGLQRLYNGKTATGLLWLFTFGLFGIGQLVDLFLIPGMVETHNAKLRSRQGLALGTGVVSSRLEGRAAVEQMLDQPRAIAPEFAANQLRVQLLAAAADRRGQLSVTQGVMATGAGFHEVESALLGIVKAGYADITNDPDTGIVIYQFREL